MGTLGALRAVSAARSAASRTSSTFWTWMLVPSATSPIAVAISWIARPASSEVPAIWREASVTPLAVLDTCPTIVRRSPTSFWNAVPSRSLSERGVTSTVRSPPAIASAADAFSRR